MKNQNSLASIKQIRMQCNSIKVVFEVMFSGGILKSGTFVREYNTAKNLISVSMEKITKKILQRAAFFVGIRKMEAVRVLFYKKLK